MSQRAVTLGSEPACAVSDWQSRPGNRLKRLLGGATVVFVGTLIWQLSNFAFSAVSAHSLGPVKYGSLAASMALLSFASPLLAAAQTVTSRETTSFLARNEPWRIRPAFSHYTRRVAAGSLVLAGAIALASGWISRLFHLGSPWLVVLVGAMIPGYLVGHMLGGLLQGAQRFASFAAETAVEGLTKAAIGILVIGLWRKSALGGMAAVAASCAAGLATYLLLALPGLMRGSLTVARQREPGAVEHQARPSHRRVPRRGVPGVVGYSMTALSTYGLLALMLSSDTLVAKHYLPGYQAGLYAGLSLTGKIAYFAASSVFIVAFPVFSQRDESRMGNGKWLAAASGIVLTTASAIVALYAIEPSWVVIPLLGSSYRPAEAFIPWMAAIFGLYALGYLMSLYLLASKRRGVIVVLAVAAAVQFTGFFIFHGSVLQIAGVLSASFGITVAADTVLVIFGQTKSTAGKAAERRDRFRQGPPARPRVPEQREPSHDRIVSEVTSRVGPVPILLGGSRALGTASQGSDFDICVVLPMWRIPRAVPTLARASAQLTTDLGIAVSVNAFPEFRVARPGGSLFAAKLCAEGVVLAAPANWSLARQRLTKVSDFAACSALLSAARALLEAFDPPLMRTGRTSGHCESAIRKAALHVAQVRLLRSGCYESTLCKAIDRLHVIAGSGPDGVGTLEFLALLEAALSAPSQTDAFLSIRECVLRQLGDISESPLYRPVPATLVRNAQYAALAALRGRNRSRWVLRRTSAEAALARAQIGLLRALDPGSPAGYAEDRLREAIAALPLAPRRVKTGSWERLRDFALAEWQDAHPLVGFFS